jgi:hypothetical protein
MGSGIIHNSGALFVENTVVDGWGTGLLTRGTAQSLFVKGSVFRNQGLYGLVVDVAATVAFAIDDSFFENNVSNGLLIVGGTGRVSNSVITRNLLGVTVENPGVVVDFQRCEVANNQAVGLVASVSSTLRVSGSTIVRNGVGLQNTALNPATVESFGNNVIRGNTTSDTSGTITPVALQ